MVIRSRLETLGPLLSRPITGAPQFTIGLHPNKPKLKILLNSNALSTTL